MIIEILMEKKKMSKYQLSKEAGVPYSTLSDICSEKTRLDRCSAETVYKLAKVLGESMDDLMRWALEEKELELEYEHNLPPYLQKDLDAYKEGMKNKKCTIMDCLWGELYGSINSAQIDDGAITAEHANYLRKKYLY